GSNGTSIFTNSANAILNAAGATVMSTGQISAPSNGNTINYTRTGNQTVKATTFYNLTLSGSGTKTTTGVTVNGKLSRQGTATVSALPTYGASAVLEYKGSAVQTTGVEFPATMNYTVIIDNINGVTLNAAKTLNDTLILVKGYLTTTTTNLLTIGANGTAIGGSTVSFVSGPLAKIKNTAAQQTFLFPVGKDSCYRPLELIITHTNTTSSTYRVELFNSAPTSRTLPSSLSAVSTERYWNITKTGTATVSAAFVVLYYDIDDGVTDPENLRVAKDNGTAWVDLGGTANGSPSGSVLSGSFTTFSDFVLANAFGGSNPLPVELISFKAVLADQEVVLTWTTQTEVDNYGFEIERQAVSMEHGVGNWEKVGFVGGNGNSNSPKEYSFLEKLQLPGKYFYRLKQIDGAGTFKYSAKLEIIIEQLPNSFQLEQNYPNPFNPETRIKFSVAEDVHTLIKVFDIIGNEVAVLFDENARAGKIYEVIFNGSKYASGIYFYSISAGTFSAVRKMMLIK
ncbi:MAG TPA: T9SS type A sorting domain-containing protein, partial [Ignavibacteriaceae bacterium]|nr:T9SS type A sorting domain-containing protein [Ignavibacteriaceae bacterium]